MTIYILTSDAGGGHRAATVRLARFLEALPGAPGVVIIDPTENMLPGLPISRLYRKTLHAMPGLWLAFSTIREIPGINVIFSFVVSKLIERRLMKLARVGPGDTMIATSSIYGHMSARYLQAHSVGLVMLVVDLISGPRSWFNHGNGATYLVLSEPMHRQGLRTGIAPANIELVCLPPSSPRATLSACQIDEGRVRTLPTVLVAAGADGVGPLPKIARGLTRASCGPNVVIVCGRNHKMLQRISRASLPRMTLLGFVGDLGKRMESADLVITKPGSMSLLELGEMGKPFVLMSGAPFSEQKTLEHLRDQYGVLVVSSESEVVTVMDALFTPDGSPTEFSIGYSERCRLMFSHLSPVNASECVPTWARLFARDIYSREADGEEAS